MKNLQIGDNDLIGNRFNGHDLHRYLRQRNIISDHLVKAKQSNDPHTFVLGEGVNTRWRCNELIIDHEKRFGTHSLHYPISFSLFTNPLFLQADIVHYHLIHNFFFNLNLLPRLTAMKPSVWTIHDPWMATGHCIYPLDCSRWKTGCGDCPHPETPFPILQDSTALNWEFKREIMEQSRFDLIVASKYMLDLLKQSPFLSRFDIHHIPFGIDLSRFAPRDSGKYRKMLGIPPENVVICFRADRTFFKGFDYVEQVLRRLSSAVPLTLLSVGDRDLLIPFREKFQIIERGWITDDDAMLDLYRTADIFLMPSLAEAFGMMAIEAMACGKPVIVFDGTALPETVFAPEGGIAVPQGDAEAMTRELELLISDKERRLKLGEQARSFAERHYDKEVYVSRIIELYEEVIAKRKIEARSKYIIEQQAKIAEKTTSQLYDPGTTTKTPPVASDAEEELARIKSSLYFKAYERLRRQKALRFISDVAVKPAIRAAWRMFQKTLRACNKWNRFSR